MPCKDMKIVICYFNIFIMKLLFRYILVLLSNFYINSMLVKINIVMNVIEMYLLFVIQLMLIFISISR